MVTYTENGNHIELYFDNIPDQTIRDTLKVYHWIWYRKNQCWSAPKNEENLQLAKTICDMINGKKRKPTPK